ncbi:MAG: porphobilinogen synthase [Bacteroidota bacterium]
MPFPDQRPRRLRATSSIRDLVQEHRLSPTDFIAPVFVVEGKQTKEEIPSMPGYYRYSLDTLPQELEELCAAGIRSVLVFVKVPDEKKDNSGTEALNSEGLMQRTIRYIKREFPDLIVMSDVALDPYSSFGHDGIIQDGVIINDRTVDVLAKMSVSHAEAGADFVAPSDMMDGRIKAIRNALDDISCQDTGIMAYSAKYASSFYGPFRDALDSAPGFGDKKTYQMNVANAKEALREIELDIEEGADIVMVKPGMPYLDIILRANQTFNTPIAAYQVSGEYAMIKAASRQGWIHEIDAMLEALIGFKRAGADLIATYFAKQAAKHL